MILIVDDEYYVTEFVKRKLNSLSLNCVTANAIKQAKQIVTETDDLELVILDLHFPYENGREFANWLKDNYPEIQRIALTAHSYEIEKNKEDADLFECILQKPIDYEEGFLKCISKYVKA